MASTPLSLWYKQPAPEWVHGMPIGNGRLGAMVLGKVRNEVWHLNEDSVWYGGWKDRNPPDALKNLPKLRQLLQDGQLREAEVLVENAFVATPAAMRHYEPLGQLTIHSHHPDGTVLDYERSLELESSLCAVSYTLDGTRYSRDLSDARWLRFMKIDEFNMLNWRWSEPVDNTFAALAAMVREGFDRLAPIALHHCFDAAYYAESHPSHRNLAPSQLYRHWLTHGLPEGEPGTASAHLKKLHLPLAAYPSAFAWQTHATAQERQAGDRWSVLDRIVQDRSLPASRIDARGDDAALFLNALAYAASGVRPDQAANLFARAAQMKTPGIFELTEWATCLRKVEHLWNDERRNEARMKIATALSAGDSRIETALAATELALEADEVEVAIKTLEAARENARGDIRWRNLLRVAIDRAFQLAWTDAERLYERSERRRADRLLTSTVADIERWWTTIDPIGAFIAREPKPRIVMLANVDLKQCTHYRVDQKVEIFAAADIQLQVFEQQDSTAFLNALPGSAGAIFYRLTATPANIRAITVCRALGIPSYYDIDDLIFDAEAYPEPIESYGPSTSKKFYATLQLGVPLFRAAMSLCDYGIASTTQLASHMKPIVRSGTCFILPNGLDHRNAPYLEASPPRTRRDDEVILFYGSGTTAHNSDFLDLVGDALVSTMQKHLNVRLVIAGYLSLDARFNVVRDRITQISWIRDLNAYWSLLTDVDINLAVLTSGATTDCKSEIKWLEAAALKVPSIVSATGRYREVLEDGKDAIIAANPQEWHEALEALVTSPDARAALSRAARAKLRSCYSIASNVARLKELLAPALDWTPTQTIPRRKRLLIFNHMFPPQTIGGSTRVARDNVDAFLDLHFDQECEIAIVTTDNDNPAPYCLRVDSYRGLPVYRMSVPTGDDMEWRPFDDTFGNFFARILDAFAPDLVHVHSIQRGTASILVECIKAGVPYVNTIHDAWWVSDYQFLTDMTGCTRQPEEAVPLNPPFGKMIGESLERRRRLRPLLEASAEILVVSDTFTALMRAAGYAGAKSLPNGVPRIEPCSKVPSASSKVRLLHLGGTSHHKGYYLLQAALRAGRFSNIELTVVQLHRSGGMVLEGVWGATPVRFVGKTPQEQVHRLYAEHDILAAPSCWPESFGLVSREAMSAGLWVIASDRGAIGEGIVEGENGWIVNVDTPEGLDRVLAEIDSQPEKYQQPPRALLAAQRSAYDQSRDLIEIYRQLFRNPHRPAPTPFFLTKPFKIARDQADGFRYRALEVE